MYKLCKDYILLSIAVLVLNRLYLGLTAPAMGRIHRLILKHMGAGTPHTLSAHLA